MSNLRSKLIRLAHANPELRPHILPMLSKQAAVATLVRVQDESAFKKAEDVADDLVDLVEKAIDLSDDRLLYDLPETEEKLAFALDVALKKIKSSTQSFLASKAVRRPLRDSISGDVTLTQKEHLALLSSVKEAIRSSTETWEISSRTFADNDDPTSKELWKVVNEITRKSRLVISLLHRAFPEVVDLRRIL